jgi:hypothetical protein
VGLIGWRRSNTFTIYFQSELSIVYNDKCMRKRYFPSCTVDGLIEPPIPFKHMASSGAVPNKCRNCQHFFEGECLRAIDEQHRYLKLDYGFCGIPGETDPVFYQNDRIVSDIEIPRKCAECIFLTSRFSCQKDAHKWGDFSRGLDWGNWQPDNNYIELPFPKITSKILIDFLNDNNLVGFVKEYRQINYGSILDAKNDFHLLKNISEKLNEKE